MSQINSFERVPANLSHESLLYGSINLAPLPLSIGFSAGMSYHDHFKVRLLLLFDYLSLIYKVNHDVEGLRVLVFETLVVLCLLLLSLFYFFAPQYVNKPCSRDLTLCYPLYRESLSVTEVTELYYWRFFSLSQELWSFYNFFFSFICEF